MTLSAPFFQAFVALTATKPTRSKGAEAVIGSKHRYRNSQLTCGSGMIRRCTRRMNVAIGSVASGNPSLGRRRWWLLVAVFFLDLFSAFSFNKFMGAAAYYSARIPITSATPADEAAQITHAHQLADRFFLIFVGLILLATLLMGPIIQLRDMRPFRLSARYVLVLVLCILVLCSDAARSRESATFLSLGIRDPTKPRPRKEFLIRQSSPWNWFFRNAGKVTLAGN